MKLEVRGKFIVPWTTIKSYVVSKVRGVLEGRRRGPRTGLTFATCSAFAGRAGGGIGRELRLVVSFV